MGWKGTVRSIGAAVRAAERAEKRRQRELEKLHKQYEKMEALEQAAYEVEVYENEIEVIQSLHKECGEKINWVGIEKSESPTRPVNRRERTEQAVQDENDYVPGFIDKLFKRVEKKKSALKETVVQAVADDEVEYEARVSSWEVKCIDWKQKVELSRLILEGDREAKFELITDINPFAEIANLGSSLEISVKEDGTVEATMQVHGEDIVPSEAKSLLKSGKLSVKKMPKGRFNEIYQDYVCSSVLRVANELFAVLVDDIVIVTALDELLNTKTGHLEKSPILSVCVSRSTLQSLNMENIDPSDSMDNFVHNMAFKKTKGFGAVKRVEPVLSGAV